MQPMLDDLALPQVQEIVTKDRRALAEHKPPGMEGSLLQNLGRRPTEVVLRGVASGPEARSFVEGLDAKFRAGEPVTFTADIVADSQIEQMLIDDLNFEELAGKPQRYEYRLTLQQHIEPVEPEDASLLDSDILDQASDLIDDLVEGLDLALPFSSGLERFVSPLSDLLGRLRTLGSASDSNP